MKRKWAAAVCAGLLALAACGNEPAPSSEELWQAAMADAVFSEDDEVVELVCLTREDPQVIEIGALSLRLQCIAYPFTAFVVVSNMMLQTIGKPLKASVTAAARSGIFFIPAILILPQVLGLLGVQMSQAVADVCSLILTIPLTFSVLAEMKRQEKVEEPLFGDH